MMVFSMTQTKVNVTSPLKSEIRQFSKAISSPIYNGGWQMTTHSYIRARYLKLFGAGFLIFVLVFVSRDFEVGRNVSCEESTVRQTRTGLMFLVLVLLFHRKTIVTKCLKLYELCCRH